MGVVREDDDSSEESEGYESQNGDQLRQQERQRHVSQSSVVQDIESLIPGSPRKKTMAEDLDKLRSVTA